MARRKLKRFLVVIALLHLNLCNPALAASNTNLDELGARLQTKLQTECRARGKGQVQRSRASA